MLASSALHFCKANKQVVMSKDIKEKIFPGAIEVIMFFITNKTTSLFLAFTFKSLICDGQVVSF